MLDFGLGFKGMVVGSGGAASSGDTLLACASGPAAAASKADASDGTMLLTPVPLEGKCVISQIDANKQHFTNLITCQSAPLPPGERDVVIDE